mgnify:CR=1 FL=1
MIYVIDILQNAANIKKERRKLMNRVKVKTPYSIVGSDYSAQEVRVLASVSED